MLKQLKAAAYPFFANYFTHATRIVGILRGSGAPATCLMVMPRNSPFQNYLLSRLFGESFKRIGERRLWIPSLEKLVRQRPAGVDFCIAALPTRWGHRFGPLCDLKSPAFVGQEIDLTGDWSEMKKRFHRKKRENYNWLMARDPFTVEISTRLPDFDHFYHRMYVPHSTKQFQSHAFVEPYEKLKAYFLKGFLMMLKEHGESIAGSLCFFDAGKMVFRRMGVLDGRDDYVDMGAQSALYLHMLRYAKEHRKSCLDLMGSRPFFNDGVQRHKREWGARVFALDNPQAWMFFFGFTHRGQATSVFRQDPIIVETPQGLMVYAVTEDGREPSAAEAARLIARYSAPGLKGVLLNPPGRTAVMSGDTALAVPRGSSAVLAPTEN